MKSTDKVKNKTVVIINIKTKNNIEWIGFLLVIIKIAQIIIKNVIKKKTKLKFFKICILIIL